MATSASRGRDPVQEAYWRWLRRGWEPLVAGNLTAVEMTDHQLEPMTSGWTPEQISTLLWLRWRYERTLESC